MKLYKNFVPISSEYFTYDSKDKTFSVWISDTNGKLDWKQLYDDACDIGFSMMSESSGKVATFSLLEAVSTGDADDEVTHWIFEPTHESVQENPQLKGVKVIVWND